MAAKRIVSFLPSATELIYELGLQKNLFGVTLECLYPNDAKSKPRIIHSVFDSNSMTSEEIDKITTTMLKNGEEIFKLNETRLLQINPDLIISQKTCEVCAAHTSQVQRALQILKKKPIIHSLDPHNIEEILKTISELTEIIGNKKEGIELENSLRLRIQKIKEKCFTSKPRVLAIEWIKPFFTAGHWIPEMIELAGGTNLLSSSGKHSRRMDIEEIKKTNPEIIIFMPCGFGSERALMEYQKNLESLPDWKKITAVKKGNVFLVDANSYFSKPSIRTITGIEILGKIIHPELFKDTSIPKNSYLKIKDQQN